MANPLLVRAGLKVAALVKLLKKLNKEEIVQTTNTIH